MSLVTRWHVGIKRYDGTWDPFQGKRAVSSQGEANRVAVLLARATALPIRRTCIVPSNGPSAA